MELDLDIEGWPQASWQTLAEETVQQASDFVPELAHDRLSASILFTTDARVHALNQEWRDRDKPTNVLSFPMMDRADLLVLSDDGPPEMLGDLALAYETCAREADAKGISLGDHATHLIVHGLLHLAGYDHETSDHDAERMEAMEIAILAKLGIADPYNDRDLKE